MRLRLVLSFLLWTTPAVAGYEFLLQDGETRIARGEVCFVKLHAEVPSPINQLFGGGPVRCFSADKIIDVPIGLWLYYGRQDGGAISRTRGLMKVTARQDDAYMAIKVPMVRSGRLDLHRWSSLLRENDRLAILVGATRINLTWLLVLPKGELSTFVPANTPVVPMIIRDGRPVNIGDRVDVESGSTATIEQPRKAGIDLVAWVDVDRSLFQSTSDERKLRQLSSLEPPSVTASNGGSVVKPLLPVVYGHDLIHTPLIFKGLSAGRATIRVDGHLWEQDSSDCELSANETIHIQEQPLRTAPASAVRIDWAMADGARTAMEKPFPSCGDDAQANRPSGVAVRLLSCKGAQPGLSEQSIDLTQCDVVRQARGGPEASGSTTFDGLPSRTYVVAVGYGGLREKFAAVYAARAEETRVDIPLQFFSFYGRVTKNNQPVRAKLTLMGETLYTSETGDFFAALSHTPTSALTIRIHSCDLTTDYVFQTTEAPQPNRAVNIEIPANLVVVKAVNELDGRPLPDVETTLVSLNNEDYSKTTFTRVEHTGKDGTSNIGSVAPETRWKICGSAVGFGSLCSEPSIIGANETKTVELKLRPSPMDGRVSVTGEMVNGVIFWVAGPNLTERSSIAADGSFKYQHPHPPTEHVVVVSDSHPLFATRPTAVEGQPLKIVMPVGVVRNIEITLTPVIAGDGGARFTVGIDGLPVPIQAFFQHQTTRGFQAVLLGLGSLMVPDILESGPVVITAVPRTSSARWSAHSQSLGKSSHLMF